MDKEGVSKMWEVIVSLESGKGYARLEHRGRVQWGKRTATKHAREFKANHMRDAWIQEVE